MYVRKVAAWTTAFQQHRQVKRAEQSLSLFERMISILDMAPDH